MLNVPPSKSHSSKPAAAGGSAPSFVTISRQIGIRFPSLPQLVADALSATPSENQPAWSAWDREIIAKAVADYQLSEQRIKCVEQSGHSWLDNFISGLAGLPDDFVIVHRLRDTVQQLAAQRHVVLVGHGAVFMTRDMPGGVHIRLVAPLRQRTENLARSLQISFSEAAERLKLLQRNWTAYLRRFWPTQSLAPETFAATFNAAALDENHLVHCIVSVAVNPAARR
jgi:hypothetical protein